MGVVPYRNITVIPSGIGSSDANDRHLCVGGLWEPGPDWWPVYGPADAGVWPDLRLWRPRWSSGGEHYAHGAGAALIYWAYASGRQPLVRHDCRPCQCYAASPSATPGDLGLFHHLSAPVPGAFPRLWRTVSKRSGAG